MSKGENALVAWLRDRFPAEPSRVPLGIGDDLAVVRLDGSLVAITTDMLLAGVHFDPQQHSYEAIGRKAIACSLSDCAASACRPRAATVSVALPDAMFIDEVKRLYEGMAAVAGEYNCALVGGDTTSWSYPLAIDVAMIAEPMARRGPVTRSGARAGDIIYVSGPLGGSLLGRHMTFAPRLDLAGRLADEPGLHAMMDISDGLALDLHRLCVASDCSAELAADLLERVISDAARKMARDDGRSPLDHALSDGEDFELLIAGDETLDRRELGLVRIGRTLPARAGKPGSMAILDVSGRLAELEPRGFEHFQ